MKAIVVLFLCGGMLFGALVASGQEARRGDTFEDRFKLDRDIPVSIAASTPEFPDMVRAEWIRFSQHEGELHATLRVSWTEGKDAKWRVRAELLGETNQVEGHALARFVSKNRTDGAFSPVIEGDLRLLFADGKSASDVVRFRVTVDELPAMSAIEFVKTASWATDFPPMPVLALDDGDARVPSQRMWSDTGLDVLAGQKIAISASGQIGGNDRAPGSWAFGPFGPEGWTADATARTGRREDLSWIGKRMFCLVGKLERGDYYEEFYVGREVTFEAPVSGRLYLGVSDGDHGDNEGAFVAQVRVDGERVDFRSLQAPNSDH